MRIFNTLQKKIVSTLVIGAAVAMIPASSALAVWGPGRTTFTWNSPASYVTFNSITDNPAYGDERAFYDARDISSSTYLDQIQVHDGQELVFRMYFHNDAATNYNLVSNNTMVKVLFPTKPTTNTASYAYISSSNANPGTVGDTVDITGSYPFTLEYETGSAQIKTNAMDGVQLSDSIFNGAGAKIGYSSLDGNVPGCSQYSGWVTFKVRVHMQMPTPPTTPTVTPTVTPTTTPVAAPTVKAPAAQAAKALPNTGPGDVLGVFAGTSAAGTALHYFVRRRQ